MRRNIKLLASFLAMVIVCTGCGNTVGKSSLPESAPLPTATEDISEPTTDGEGENSPPADFSFTDIVLIRRNYSHGFNDYDTGTFLMSDGRVFSYDATGLEHKNKYSRFADWDELYTYLVAVSESESPTFLIDAEAIMENLQSMSWDDSDWHAQVAAMDAGADSLRAVRIIDGEMQFDEIYCSGDVICGYFSDPFAIDIIQTYIGEDYSRPSPEQEID